MTAPAAVDADERPISHVPALDGLRGLAILLVLFWHLFPKSNLDGSVLLAPFGLVRDLGWTGVDLFFVISGFLITSILIRNKGSRTYFRTFYARRFLRIFPLYYLLLAVCIFVLPGFAYLEKYDFFWRGEGNPVWYWLFLSNLRYQLDIPGHQFLGVTWSLSIEEQYYVVWPLIVWLCSWRVLILVEIGLIVLSVALRFYFLEVAEVSSKLPYFFTFSHLDGLAVGGLIALLLSRATDWHAALDRFAGTLPIWFAVALSIGGYAVFFSESRYATYDPVMLKYGYLANALFFGALLLHCVIRDGPIARVFRFAPLRSVGKYSYAMYLLHWPCFYLVGELLALVGVTLGQGLAADATAFALHCAATYAVAVLSWVALEGPINGLKHRFRY